MPSRKRKPWFQHRVYSRYWTLYHQMMGWHWKHRAARSRAESMADSYENAALSSFIQSWRYPQYNNSSEHHDGVKRRHLHDRQVCAETPVQVHSDVEEVEMEITEEFLDFLAQSERHRCELRLQRAKELKDNSSEKDLSGVPKEQPGVRRTAEMKILYGQEAALIHGMETAMQLTCDRNCDLHQPKFWPTVPFCI